MTNAKQLAARGVPITLADGREVRLRYDMEALEAIEGAFGSLAAMQEELAEDKKMFTALNTVIAAGLKHEGLSREDVVKLMDPAELEAYSEAMSEAFDQAFPQKAQAARENVAELKPTSPSPGPISTISPQPDLAATMSNFGA